MKRKQPVALFALIRRVMHTYSSCHLSRSAAAVAYDLLLALFPMIVCFSVLLYRRVPVASSPAALCLARPSPWVTPGRRDTIWKDGKSNDNPF